MLDLFSSLFHGSVHGLILRIHLVAEIFLTCLAACWNQPLWVLNLSLLLILLVFLLFRCFAWHLLAAHNFALSLEKPMKNVHWFFRFPILWFSVEFEPNDPCVTGPLDIAPQILGYLRVCVLIWHYPVHVSGATFVCLPCYKLLWHVFWCISTTFMFWSDCQGIS